jgi:RNAse (barnase) inhibitor barstar
MKPCGRGDQLKSAFHPLQTLMHRRYGSVMAKEYVLDGRKITSLEAFYDQVSSVLIPGADWGRNLDAFNDILRGGFGTPPEGFVLRWTHSATSRANLGYAETVRQLEERLRHCHPTNRDFVRAGLKRAQEGVGATVFDWLVEIIHVHGVGGEEAEDSVSLLLE